ncbi:helix-turn-helix domain-containing protein [Roseibium polysiphoniae]|nr:XRE family transcriptional regulator [Roseibium polysiphoniae]
MSMSPTLTPIALIARALQRERTRAGMSLSSLAKEAGLAKSTLSQLEAGQGNPSVETLWAIANALNVPFSFLFETKASETKLIRAGEGTPVSADHADFRTTLLANCPPGVRRDLYRAEVRKGDIRSAKAHPAGTVEHALVVSGRVRTGPAGMAEDLEPGDYYRYPADVPHSYETLSDKAVLVIVMEVQG